MMMPPTTLMKVIRRAATASPRTNFEAPSMAPKKDDSSSSAARRAFAAFSSMRPAERSASIAICLPGIASRVKRAATSAMRPEPFVITTKFTMIRIANTMIPITKLPPMTKWPKASITCPAAAVPSWPWPRIRRVEARLSASRSIVAISSSVGKTVNSSGLSIDRPVIMISTDMMIDTARSRSSRIAGSGKISTARIAMTPVANSRSERLDSAWISPRVGSTIWLRTAAAPIRAGALAVSAIDPTRRQPPGGRPRGAPGKICRPDG
jgi:hypothetical protein